MMKGIIFILLLIYPILGISQVKEVRNITKYTSLQGLSSYNIRKVVQDPFGFIWIATQDGLNRFDGRNFLLFKKNELSGRTLLGADVRDILVDSTTNLLWVLTGEGGLNAIDLITTRIVKTVPITSFTNEDWNICMNRSRGKIWIGRFNGIAIYDIQKENIVYDTAIAKKGYKNIADIRNIYVDGKDNVWIPISGYGIIILSSRDGKMLAQINFNNNKKQVS